MYRAKFPGDKYIREITAKQVANLRKLATKLETVPNKQFDMSIYYENPHNWQYTGPAEVSPKDYKPECGTCACAVGWGPAAGVKVQGTNDWNKYAEKAFGAPWFVPGLKQPPVYGYLFDGDRGGTAKQAAKRIWKVVERWEQLRAS